MHLPEDAAVRGDLRSLGRQLCVRVDVRQRKVPPDVADVTEVPEQLPDNRLGHTAVRTLEVAVLDDGNGSVDRSADVVVLRIDVDVQVDDRLRRPQQRADASTPGQQRGRAEEEPREYRRRERRGKDPDLRLLELATVEDERRDEDGDREADPRDRAAAGDRDPADGGLEGPSAYSCREPGRSEDATGLPTT